MKEAAKALRARSFDAVMITSEALPGDDVKMLGEIARPQPHMPVILVTLDCDLARSKEAMRNGACDILVWPFTSAELPLLIERNLERRRQERRRLVIRGTNVLMQAIEALVAAVDSRDPFIAGHSEQVAEPLSGHSRSTEAG